MIESTETSDYKMMDTAALLELLRKEEDRLTEAHIRELATRPEAITQLRRWLTEIETWDSEIKSEWWIPYHAFIALCLHGEMEVLDDALIGLEFSYEYDFDWLFEDSIAGLAKFGVPAIERFIQYVNEHRGKEKHLPDITYLRSRIVSVLTRIALEHPDEQPRIASFVTSLYTDNDELDDDFLAFCIHDALFLDRENAARAIRQAYDNQKINEDVAGTYDDSIARFDRSGHIDERFLKADLLKFYQPSEIARRQIRWTREKEIEEERKRKPLTQVLRDLSGRPQTQNELAGYMASNGGALIRESEKIGRNEPCPCGSGKKFKKCCDKN